MPLAVDASGKAFTWESNLASRSAGENATSSEKRSQYLPTIPESSLEDHARHEKTRRWMRRVKEVKELKTGQG